MYELGRVIAVTKLSESNLKDMHEREKKREFIFPWFQMKSLYFGDLGRITIPKIRDDDRESMAQMVFEVLPDPKHYGLEKADYYDLDYVHALDIRVHHSSEITNRISMILATSSRPKEKANAEGF